MSQSAEALSEYLRAVIHDTSNATIDLAKVDSDYLDFAQELIFLQQCIAETKELAQRLADGCLSVALPRADNEIAAPLKELHTNLHRLTWKTQQVARGDYKQKLNYTGEFSVYFNSMVDQLEQRQAELQEEVAESERKTRALQQNIDLMEALTQRAQQWIYVADRDTGEVLFSNQAMQSAMDGEKRLRTRLQHEIRAHTMREAGETWEVELVGMPEQNHFYSVLGYSVSWRAHDAIAYVVTNVSGERLRVKELENYAYQDVMTGLGNRFSGMQHLQQLMESGADFGLCFVDMDHLKLVNDTYGHLDGDIYINHVGDALRNFAPLCNTYRVGGDEFMLLITGLDSASAQQRMQELRDKLANSMPEGCDPPWWPLCSISYGMVFRCENPEFSASEMLALADGRMYAFKQINKMERRKQVMEIDFPTR